MSNARRTLCGPAADLKEKRAWEAVDFADLSVDSGPELANHGRVGGPTNHPNPPPPRAPMHIMLLQVELRLHDCHSLKEKRSILKPLLHDLQSDYNISVAETDGQDEWQSAVLAMVAVGNTKPVLEAIERKLEEFLESLAEAQVAGWQKEWL